MVAKRKRSRAGEDQENATGRQLRSGRSVGASPDKVQTPSRSPRKRALLQLSDASNPEEEEALSNDEENERSSKARKVSKRPPSRSPPSRSPRKARAGNPTSELVEETEKELDNRATSPAKGLKTPRKRPFEAKARATIVADLVTPAADLSDADGKDDLPTEATSRRTTRTPKRSRTIVEVAIASPFKRSTTVIEPTPPLPPSDHCLYDPLFDEPPPGVPKSPATSHASDSSNRIHDRLDTCLNAQKKEILRALQNPTFKSSEVLYQGDAAWKQLSQLIQGTVLRAEGNSCLLLGPRGSGKTLITESCLAGCSQNPITLRLSGWVQTTDKLALREIALQLLQQTGSSFLPDTELAPSNSTAGGDEDENPFLDRVRNIPDPSADQDLRLPPSSQLHSLIPLLLTLGRPVIVILDAFDLFALHPRQSLLYCLLDTVQSSRATSENRGIAVIGITSRLDTVQLLEKRVKSRFSGRTIRTAPPNDLKQWITMVKDILQVPAVIENAEWAREWQHQWNASVDKFLASVDMKNALNETFSISRDIKVLQRLLTRAVLRLNADEPYMTRKVFTASIESQRSRPRNLHFNNLTYPMICLLIASVHAETAGHQTFTFEMLFEKFRDQLRSSTSAPVQVNGGHIGMVKCTRDVLLTAFDGLIAARIFVSAVAPSTTLAKEYVKHRSVVDRESVKKVVEISAQIYLKKWLHKS